MKEGRYANEIYIKAIASFFRCLSRFLCAFAINIRHQAIQNFSFALN